MTFYETISFDGFVKSPNYVTPAKAVVQKLLKWLDSGFRRNDEKGIFGLFTSPSALKY